MVGSLQSCSPDPTTNSETTNPIFHDFFGQLEQVLQVLFIYLLKINGQNQSERKFENWKFNFESILELVIGSGEQIYKRENTYFLNLRQIDIFTELKLVSP